MTEMRSLSDDDDGKRVDLLFSYLFSHLGSFRASHHRELLPESQSASERPRTF